MKKTLLTLSVFYLLVSATSVSMAQAPGLDRIIQSHEMMYAEFDRILEMIADEDVSQNARPSVILKKEPYDGMKPYNQFKKDYDNWLKAESAPEWTDLGILLVPVAREVWIRHH